MFPNFQHWNIVRWNENKKTPDFPARTQMKIGNVFCFRNALVLRAKIQTSTWIVHSIAQFTVAIAANIHISPSIRIRRTKHWLRYGFIFLHWCDRKCEFYHDSYYIFHYRLLGAFPIAVCNCYCYTMWRVFLRVLTHEVNNISSVKWCVYLWVCLRLRLNAFEICASDRWHHHLFVRRLLKLYAATMRFK